MKETNLTPVPTEAADLTSSTRDMLMPRNFVDILIQRAHEKARETLYVYLDGPQLQEKAISYAEVELRARAIATRLQSMGLRGERVLLIYQCDLDYILGFFGCLFAGAIAVPVYPPASNKHFARMNSIVEDCQARHALSTASLIEKIEALPDDVRGPWDIKMIASDKIDTAEASGWTRPSLKPDELAFLQYTSGSTGNPKGVMVSHDNLVSNCIMSRDGYGLSDKDIILSWLPLYHDLGLIGGVLQPLFLGIKCYLMNPMTIVRPHRWLEAVTKYKATFSGGPNFAFDLCVSRVSEEQRKKIDLSSIRGWVCGAEPIRYSTLKAFTDAYAEQGASLHQFVSSYGLAEATLCVSNKGYDAEKVFRAYKKKDLETGRAVLTTFEDADGHVHVGCGVVCRGQKVKIVDPSSMRVLEAGQVGEIWVNGAHITKGYWNRPEETARTFHNEIEGERYLRTGDLGFFDENGELFITGRCKDLIIIRGRNYYPQDLELVCSNAHPRIRNAVAAAFSIQDHDQEKLVIVQEVPIGTAKDLLPIIEQACRQAILEEFGVELHALVFLEHGGVPRTSSGKIRRSSAKADFMTRKLRYFSDVKLNNPTLFRLRKKLDRRRLELYVLFRISSRRALSILPLANRGS